MALRTDMWLDAVDDYAKAYDKGVDAELENMKMGASLESWTGKMQELKEACICMPRHFLMCWLAARSLGKDLFSDETYTREFEEFICKVKPLNSGEAEREVSFEAITQNSDLELSEDERDRYIIVLAHLAAENENDILTPWRDLFRKAFLLSEEDKKNLEKGEGFILKKEEGLKIAHALRMTYSETNFFLIRALENDGFEFTKADDILHVYCLLRGQSLGDYTRLKKQYEENTAEIKKQSMQEKPENFTVYMMPEDEEVMGECKDSPSLTKKIKQWMQENGEEDQAVDTAFMKWLVSQAPYLDLPGKTACSLYRKLAAYVYAKSDTGKKYIKRDETEFYDPFSTEELAGASEELSKICSMTSSYSMEEADYDKFVKKLLDKMNEMTGKVYRKHKDRLVRYLYVDEKGKIKSKVIADRIPELLKGKIQVEKADMLFMVWLVCSMFWENTEEGTLSQKIWGYIDSADAVLEEAHLPQFYAPHILERTFILSFCLIGLESDNDEIMYGGLTPIQIYEALSRIG